MTYTITLPVEWTHEEIMDNVWGNYCLAHPWWTYLDGSTKGDPILTGRFGSEDDGDDLIDFSISTDEWLRAAKQVALEYPHWRDSILNKDIDAELGDMILQQAVAGSIIYG